MLVLFCMKVQISNLFWEAHGSFWLGLRECAASEAPPSCSALTAPQWWAFCEVCIVKPWDVQRLSLGRLNPVIVGIIPLPNYSSPFWLNWGIWYKYMENTKPKGPDWCLHRTFLFCTSLCSPPIVTFLASGHQVSPSPRCTVLGPWASAVTWGP